MKIVITIEARMGSTRLPGKVLMPILGRPMLAYMIERLQRVSKADKIVVATTDNPNDDPIADLATNLGVGLFRGSEEDVLDRVLSAASSANADVIVETSGDCPLIDPEVVDQVIGVYLANKFDFVNNGLDIEIFSKAVLYEVSQLTKDPIDREHVSLYIYEHPERFSFCRLETGLPEKYQNLRLTVDTLEDFTLISKIFEELYPKDPAFSLGNVLALLDRRPELIEINRHIKPKPVR